VAYVRCAAVFTAQKMLKMKKNEISVRILPKMMFFYHEINQATLKLGI
jgi:hypothetical protein